MKRCFAVSVAAISFLYGCTTAVSSVDIVNDFSAADAACEAAATYSEDRRGVSVLILRDGNVICEDYAEGVRAEDAYRLASGTKSFSGVMALFAMEDGLLELDEPVVQTISEWEGDPERQDITVRNLLNLTSGLGNMPRSQRRRTPSFAQAESAPLRSQPGENFRYGPVPFQLFGEIMKRKLAVIDDDPDPVHYLERKLFNPAGIDIYNWRRPVTGDPLLPAGVSMTAREWAKFGEFVRLRGKVGEAQLLPADLFDALYQGTKANPGYGLTWWLPEPGPEGTWAGMANDLGLRKDEVPEDLIVAAGAGGQRLFVIESEGLTIVRQAYFTADMTREERIEGWSDTDFLLLARHAAISSAGK